MFTPNSAIKKRFHVYKVTLVAALAGLLFGLDLGVISGALPFIKPALQLSITSESWVVSAALFGAAVGAIISGWLSSKIGRKYSLLISSLLFALASIISAISHGVEILIVARTFLGISVGIATFNAPLYLAEISPANIRGSLVTFYQLMITVGIVLAFLSDLLFTASGNWRLMLGIIALPALIMFFLLCYLPKSPRWLMLNGFHEQAANVLQKLLNEHEFNKSLERLKVSTEIHRESIMTLLRKNPFVKVVLFAIGLQIIQQFSGMNAMLYYAPEIFSYAGYNSHADQMWATFLIGIVNMIVTIFAIRFIEKLGRRWVLYFSGGMILISTLFLGLMFLGNNHNTVFMQYASLGMVFLFIIGYALGYGPVVWVLCAEIFPLNGRSFAMACATTANWVATGIVGAVTLPLIKRFGIGHFYLLLSIFAFFSLVYFRLFVPETRGESLEKIEYNLWQEKPLRELANN